MGEFTDDIKLDANGEPIGYYGCAVGEDGLPSEDKRQEYFRHQRDTVGFDATETWSLFQSTLMFMIPRLKYFSDNLGSYPPGLTSEQWKTKLEEFTVDCEILGEGKRFEEENKARVRWADFMNNYFFHLLD